MSNMSSIWKFNTQEANGKECEDGIGDGGILIYADTEDDALNKLYYKCCRDNKFSRWNLPEFDSDEDDIPWDTYSQTEWKDRLRRVMKSSPTYAFITKFPPHNILK